MNLVAKIHGNQIRVQKHGRPFTSLVAIKESQRMWESGRVTDANHVFLTLVEHQFDVKKTIEHYREAKKIRR